MNYFPVVLRIIFLMYIKNYFLIGPRIIFRGIANLFFRLQCTAGLAFEVDWFFLQNLSGASSLCVCDEVFWTEDLIEETTKRLHDSYTILTLIEHDM